MNLTCVWFCDEHLPEYKNKMIFLSSMEHLLTDGRDIPKIILTWKLSCVK